MRRSLWFSLIGLFALDRLAKGWALSSLIPHSVGPGLTLHCFGLTLKAALQLVTNQGAAWGFFANAPQQLMIVRICLITAILYCVWRSKDLTAAARFSWLCIALLAFSNLLDVFFYGYIVDMISLHLNNWEFAVFNPADAVISAAWLALFTMQLHDSKSLRGRG